jgi:hypothetical protein
MPVQTLGRTLRRRAGALAAERSAVPVVHPVDHGHRTDVRDLRRGPGRDT